MQLNKTLVATSTVLIIFICAAVLAGFSDYSEDAQNPIPIGIDYAVYYSASKLVASDQTSALHDERFSHTQAWSTS